MCPAKVLYQDWQNLYSKQAYLCLLFLSIQAAQQETFQKLTVDCHLATYAKKGVLKNGQRVIIGINRIGQRGAYSYERKIFPAAGGKAAKNNECRLQGVFAEHL